MNEKFQGLGKKQRQAMKKRWREEGQGQSLKQWAAQNALVGDAAQAWLNHKRGK